MSQSRTALMRLTSFRGGLNDTDPPHRIDDDQLSQADEIELTTSGGVRRRWGTVRASAQPASADLRLLVRHTPSQNLSGTEVWALGVSASNFYRSTTGTTWTTVSVSDTGSSTAPTDAVSFNGKLYIAYEKNAGTDRLHCWDGTTLRRVGISTPSAPSVANTGSGSYAATIRYYKVSFSYTSGANFTLSDLSPAVSFTPSGSGTAARITKPTTPDGATSWAVWASADGISYNLITSQAVGTTTYDDSAAPSTYTSNNISYLPYPSGEFTPPWSAKYLLVDENRLLIAGAFETARYASRVGWSAILGTASAAYGDPAVINDDERFPTDNYLDLDSDEGGEITGMEMLNGSVYVFKRYATYKLVRTGNAEVPYKPVVVSKTVGALSRRSIIPGEDESGTPCLYFLSDAGPYRIGAGAGLQYLGGDIETTWASVAKRGWIVPPHGVYDGTANKVRWWVPREDFFGQGDYPDQQLVFHVRLARPSASGRVTGGWTTTALATKPNSLASSAMLPSDLSNRDTPLAPYGLAYSGSTWTIPAVLWKFDVQYTLTDDRVNSSGAITATDNINPQFTTKTFSLGLGDQGGVRDVYVVCTPASPTGNTLSVTLSRDFGAETRVKTQTYTGTTTRMPLQIPDLTMAQAQYIGVSIYSSTQQAWVVDEVALRISREEPV